MIPLAILEAAVLFEVGEPDGTNTVVKKGYTTITDSLGLFSMPIHRWLSVYRQ